MSDVERVFAAVDIMNLWYSGREMLGIDVRVNYAKLKDLIYSKSLGSYPRIVHLVAYTITASARQDKDGSIKHHNEPPNAKFMDSLKKIGYEIRNRNLYIEKGPKKPYASDWDVGIAIDAIDKINEYDTFCLASGDGDYAILIENLRARNKYVEVVTFNGTTSKLIHATANRVTYLTENELFRQDPGGEPHSQKPR
jgi:uncharacterized LabA/DUF88 family protein